MDEPMEGSSQWEEDDHNMQPYRNFRRSLGHGPRIMDYDVYGGPWLGGLRAGELMGYPGGMLEAYRTKKKKGRGVEK